MVAEQAEKSTKNKLEKLQQELADSRARFRNVIERNADGILIVGAKDGIVRYLNPAAEELFGVSAEELEGEMFGFPVVAGRKSSIDIVRCDRSDVVAEMHVVETEWGGEPALLASLRDITPRVRILRALEQSEKRYRILFDRAGDAIFVVSLQGDFLDANQVACQRYGYSLDELLEMTPKGLTTPERAGKVDQIINEIIQQGSDVFETVHRCADGSTLPVEINAQVIEHIEQKAILCVVRDITERKQADKALRWQQEADAAMADLSKNLLESIPIEDISYRVLEYAKTLTASTFGYVGYIDPESGYLVSSTMTRDVWDQCHVPDKDIVFKEFAGLWGWVLENRQPLMTNAPNEDPRSSGVPLGHVPIERFLSVPAMIGDELVGQIALANPESDYSERDLRLAQRLASIYALALQRKRAEDALAAYSHQLEEMVEERTEALRQAQEKALRQERLAALGQLAGGVAHDLRNPLSVIASAIYYLKMVQPNAEDVVLEYLDMIDDEVKTADRIVADLLDFARDKTVVPRAVGLDEIVAHVLDRKPPPQGIGLALQIPEDLPQAYMDSGHLKQILNNLITNAYQAMSDGGILTLRASTVDERVQLDVSDTGEGIPPENMEKIFEPLFTTKSRGIGLGLAICQKLIEANQGDISVTSEEGAGSTFTITMPIYQERDDDQEQSQDD